MHTFKVSTLDLQISRHLGTHGKADGIVIFKQLLGSDVLAYLNTAFELDALLFQ